MDQNQREDVTGDALAREIERALAMDPSPEFVARVRDRIVGEPAPAAWWASWKLAAIGAAAVGALVLTVVAWRGGDGASTPAAPRALRRQASASVLPKADTALLVPSRGAATDVPPPGRIAQGPHGTGRARSRTAEPRTQQRPEVLIDPGEAAALRRLIADVRERRIEPSALPESLTVGAAPLRPIEDIVVEPVIVPPLSPFRNE